MKATLSSGRLALKDDLFLNLSYISVVLCAVELAVTYSYVTVINPIYISSRLSEVCRIRLIHVERSEAAFFSSKFLSRSCGLYVRNKTLKSSRSNIVRIDNYVCVMVYSKSGIRKT